jgi:HlyD family secretion protein
MNQYCLTKNTNLHQQKQHASFNRPFKKCVPQKKSILLVLITLIFLSFSCKNKETKAFAYGNFESEEIIVSAEASGKLNEFNLIEGMNLKPSDYIGYIDTTQYYLKKLQLLTGINSVNARLAQIDKQLVVNEVSMKNLVREKNRIDSLLEGGAATTRQLDDIIGQIDLLNAQTDAIVSQKLTIRTEIESLNIQIMQVNDFIAKSLIKSPTSGIVLEKYLYEGELAITGKPLFKMADVTYLILRVFVSGSQIEQIKIGSEVSVYIDTKNNDLKEYKGIVSWISDKSEFTPKIIQTRDERVNLVYAVKIRVTNDGSLKIGMPGEIRLFPKS